MCACQSIVRALLPPLAVVTLAHVAGGCAGPPRWVAVADSSGTAVTVMRGDLRRRDTMRLPSAGRLVGLAFGSGGASLYVATTGAAGGRVLVTRRADGRVLDAAAFDGRRVEALTTALDGDLLVIATAPLADSIAGRVTVTLLDVTLQPAGAALEVCTGPLNALTVFDPGRLLYVLCEGRIIVEVDLALRRVVRTDTLPAAEACRASDLEISANGTVLFALCADRGDLLYVDHRTLTVLETLAIGTGPLQVVRTPGGRHAAFPSAAAGEVVTADLRRRRIASRPRTPFVPRDLAVGIDGRSAYVAGGDPGAVVVLDLERGRITASTATEPPPASIAVWPARDTPVMHWTR